MRLRPAHASRALLALLALLSLPVEVAAGSSDPGGGRFWPGKQRWRAAARAALADPATWVPTGGALAVWAGDWDDDIAEWAVESTPVFGSPERARDASDRLRTASHLGMITTALFVHGGETPWPSRLRRLGVEQAGVFLTQGITGGLKTTTDRERPDGSDRRSFPSGHSSQAFAYAAATSRNLAAGGLSGPLRRGLRAGFVTLAVGTAWARVEAGVHYPTDVLAGAALGNFVSRLVTDAFFGQREDLVVGVTASPGRVAVAVSLAL